MAKLLNQENELTILNNLRYVNERLQEMLNNRNLMRNPGCSAIAAVKFKLDGVFDAITGLEEVKNPGPKKSVKENAGN